MTTTVPIDPGWKEDVGFSTLEGALRGHYGYARLVSRGPQYATIEVRIGRRIAERRRVLTANLMTINEANRLNAMEL